MPIILIDVKIPIGTRLFRAKNNLASLLLFFIFRFRDFPLADLFRFDPVSFVIKSKTRLNFPRTLNRFQIFRALDRIT